MIDQDELALRALFAEAPRPPLGDERFVKAVMARVETDTARASARRTALWVALGAGLFGVVSVNSGDVVGLLADVFPRLAAQAAPMSAGLMSMVIVLAAAAGGWALAERG